MAHIEKIETHPEEVVVWLSGEPEDKGELVTIKRWLDREGFADHIEGRFVRVKFYWWEKEKVTKHRHSWKKTAWRAFLCLFLSTVWVTFLMWVSTKIFK